MFIRKIIQTKQYSSNLLHPSDLLRFNDLTVSLKSKAVFILCLALGLGCSSRPTTPILPKAPKHKLPPSVFMGPPSLLALTEGTIDTPEAVSGEKYQRPQLSLIQKKRSKTIIQLWFKAGVLNESKSTYGSTIILDELLTKGFNSESLNFKLKAMGVDFDSWISPDRYVFSFSCSPEQVQETLTLLSSYLKNFADAQVINALNQTRTHSTLWFKRRLVSRLVLENLKRLNSNEKTLPDSFYINPQELQKLDLSTIRKFIDQILQPSNLHIVAIGDLDKAKLKKAITKNFTSPLEDISAPAEVSNESSATAQQALDGDDASSNISLVDLELMDINRTFIQLAFPVQNLSSEEASYLDLLSFILIGDQYGILHRQAERSGIELKSASSTSVITDQGTVFVVSVEVSSAQTDDAWNILLETFNRLLHQPISQRNLERAKSLFERETLLIGESLNDQARRLGFFNSHWPNTDALNRYGLAAYQVRPSTLFKFTQERLMSKVPYVLISGKNPSQSNPDIWQERMIQQLKQAMTQQNSTNLVGFSQHGDHLKLLFHPSQSEGVTSLMATITFDLSSTKSSLRSPSALALGHWFAALLSEPIPNEPRFKANFHDEGLTLSSTFPSYLIGEVFNALMKKLRQAPLRTETLWSNEYIERARNSALSNLSKQDKDPLKKLNFVNQRLSHAFSKWTYPLPKIRQDQLAKLSSSELSRWFSQHIQSAPLNLVVSGDVSEKTLGRTLSPLSLNQSRVPQDSNRLKSSPHLPNPHKSLKKCRIAKILTNTDQVWASLSFPVPSNISAEGLLILKAALLYENQEISQAKPIRRIVLDAPNKPLMLTIYLESKPKDFESAWQALNKDVRMLKEQLQAPLKIKSFKSFSQRLLYQYFTLSSQQAHWLLRSWFLNWHQNEILEQNTLRSKLLSVSNEDLLKTAQAIFDEQQMQISFLSSPDVQLPSDLNCQKVIP